LIQPSVASAPGRGRRRLYSFKDIVAIRAAQTLREFQKQLPRLVKELKGRGYEYPLADVKLEPHGKDIALRHSAAEIESMRRLRQLYLDFIEEDLDKRIKAEHSPKEMKIQRQAPSTAKPVRRQTGAADQRKRRID
jgi:hypothetical protein